MGKISHSPVVDANNVGIGTRKTLLSRKEVSVEVIFSFVGRWVYRLSFYRKSSGHFTAAERFSAVSEIPAAAGDEQRASWLTIETPAKPTDTMEAGSSQPITPESISVDVDHWRGTRQQLAMKAWTQFQLARCDGQCGNLWMTAQAK